MDAVGALLIVIGVVLIIGIWTGTLPAIGKAVFS
jgi:hypothetical protein